MTFESASVSPWEGPLAGLLEWVNRTAAFRPDVGRPLMPNGYYASVVRLTDEIGLAICTDTVGTKVLVAEMLGKYDTIGIDCVAMNVNDLLCVGAEPIAMVDCIASNGADPEVLSAVGQGLYEGARQANVTIPGGELAQLPGVISGSRPGSGLELMGTAVGVVHPDRILTGSAVAPGDVVIGLPSSGIHSNGFTLARRMLFERGKLRPEDHVAELGRSVGEELLEPTTIYVRGVLALLRAGVPVKACAHITGDGFLNVARGSAPVGFQLPSLPAPQPIFALIQRLGQIATGEMYYAFNMGIGFCVVVAAAEADRALALLHAEGYSGMQLGHAVADRERRVCLPSLGLVGEGGRFRPV